MGETDSKVPMLLMERRASYWPFAVSAFLRSHRSGGDERLVSDPVYHHFRQRWLENAWRDPGMVWAFAAHPTNTEFLYGFIVGEGTDAGPVLHYAYTRPEDRRLGVAGALLSTFAAGAPKGWTTHTTSQWRQLLRGSTRFGVWTDEPRVTEAPTKDTAWLYCPYLLWDGCRWARGPGRPAGLPLPKLTTRTG